MRLSHEGSDGASELSEVSDSTAVAQPGDQHSELVATASLAPPDGGVVPAPSLRSLPPSALLETVRDGGGTTPTAGSAGATPDFPSCTDPNEDLMPSQRYDVRDRLGRGGGGDVFAVHDAYLEREVALKVMQSGGRAPRQAAARFMSEARLTARLDHPNILPVYDLGRDRHGRVYFSMRKAVGKNLAELIQEAKDARAPAPIATYSDRVEVMLRIADAVAYAHSRHVIHRDLKPSNIVVGEFGEVIVIDWGTAYDVRKQQHEVGLVVGTPAYMSPEQARGEVADERSDVYCLGGIFWSMLTLGRPSFVGLSDEEFWLRKLDGQLPEPPPGVPQPLLDIARRALAAQAPERYQSASALRDALREWQRYQASAAFCERAKRSRAQAHSARDHGAFLRACDDYRSALEEWPDNPAARRGLAEALAEHARFALARGDTALASDLLLEGEPLHDELRAQVARAREVADASHRRLVRLRLLALLGVLTALAAGGWVFWQWRLAVGAWQTVWTFDALRDSDQKLRPMFADGAWRARIEGDALILPERQLYYLANASATGNVELEAEVTWATQVDGFELVVKSAGTPPESWHLPAGYSCQFGGWEGTTTFISQNRKAGAPILDHAVAVRFEPGRRYVLRFTVERDEAALHVDGVEKLRLRSLLPLGDLTYRDVGVRTWADVRIHKLTLRRQSLPVRPTPLVAGDALVAAGHHRDALHRYQEVADDFQGTPTEEEALARGYLTSLLDPELEQGGNALLERLVRGFPRSRHRGRCEEAAALKDFRAGRRDEALARAAAVLDRDPKSRVVVPMLTGSSTGISKRQSHALLALMARTEDIGRADLRGLDVDDLSPIQHLRVPYLVLQGLNVRDLSPLRQMPLKVLDVSLTSITSLEPLRGMPLESLNLAFTKVSDLSPLDGLPLVVLNIEGTGVSDLRPLRKARLQRLLAGFTRVQSVEPLRGMPLRSLDINATGIQRLEPLRGAPLADLYASGNRIEDLGFAQGMPLRNVGLARNAITDITPLAGLRGDVLDLAGNRIQSIAALAGSSWRELNVSQNPLESLEPLRGVARELTLADLPPQRVAVLSHDSLEVLELTRTRLLDPESIPSFLGLAQLRLVGAVPARSLEELAQKARSLGSESSLASSLEIQAAYMREDVDALKALASAGGGRRAVFLPFELPLADAHALARRLGGRLPMLADPAEQALVDRLLPDAADAWLATAEGEGSARWADGSDIADTELRADHRRRVASGAGLSRLRLGSNYVFAVIAPNHPQWSASPIVVWER